MGDGEGAVEMALALEVKALVPTPTSICPLVPELMCECVID